jgi:hypothetical protein
MARRWGVAGWGGGLLGGCGRASVPPRNRRFFGAAGSWVGRFEGLGFCAISAGR